MAIDRTALADRIERGDGDLHYGLYYCAHQWTVNRKHPRSEKP